MSILKTVFIFTLILAVVSARSRQRSRGRSSHRQRGRDAEEEGDTSLSAAKDDNGVISEALDTAVENHEILADPGTLSPTEAHDAGAAIVDNLVEAIEVTSDNVQALEYQPEIVEEQVQDTYGDLEKALNYAKKYQTKLSKHSDTLTPDEYISYQAKLHKYLELALHYAVQHDAAVQKDKAVEAGAEPEEAAAVAEEVVAAGRAMKAASKTRA